MIAKPRASLISTVQRKTIRKVYTEDTKDIGELFPRVGFIVTNLRWKSKNVVKFYNKRGTAEQWIKEGKNAINWTRLSCHDFDDNPAGLANYGVFYINVCIMDS